MAFGPKVLLTGANGYIATQILLDLLKENYEVVGTVRSDAKIQEMISWTPELQSSIDSEQLTFDVVASFVVEDAWDHVLKTHQGFDYVLHTASPWTVYAKDYQNDLIDPAVKGTKYLLESVYKHAPSVKRIVITASFASIHDSKNGGPRPGYTYTAEDWQTLELEDALTPRENSGAAYSYSKKAAELAAWDFVKEVKPNFDLVVLNPPAVRGPPMQPMRSLPEGGMSTMTQYNMLRGNLDKPPAHGVWLWVDVRDLSIAHLKAIQVKEAGGKRFLVTEGNFSNVDIARIMNEKFPQFKGKGMMPEPSKEDKPYPDGGVYKGDNTPSKEILGLTYTPIEKCVVDTVNRIVEVEKKL